jgi:hypothetical protein
MWCALLPLGYKDPRWLMHCFFVHHSSKEEEEEEEEEEHY